MTEFRVLKNDEIPDDTILICTPADMPSPFDDNVRGPCSRCGCVVQHRPHVKPGLKLMCLRCYDELREEFDEHAMSDKTLAELKALGMIRKP